MRDVDLFLSLAEIAGVFVGFGALIALHHPAASGAAVTTKGDTLAPASRTSPAP